MIGNFTNRALINLLVRIIIILFVVVGVFIYGVGVGKYAWPPHDTLAVISRAVIQYKPITLYVIADAHVGHKEKAEYVQLFAHMCNINKPDIVIDLGDCIAGEITELYNYSSDKQAAIAQQNDYFFAWNSIQDNINKQVALGNRDLISIKDSRGLQESQWIDILGYESRPKIGGTKLQTAFETKKRHIMGSIKVKTIIFVTDAANYDENITLEWAKNLIREFDGDMIIFANHNIALYREIRDFFIIENIGTPAIYLYGHNHGSDTLTRDARGYESDKLDFPSYLMVNFFGTGIGAKFEIYKGGTYNAYRIDTINQEISKPGLH